jgi:hypothetical protein
MKNFYQGFNAKKYSQSKTSVRSDDCSLFWVKIIPASLFVIGLVLLMFGAQYYYTYTKYNNKFSGVCENTARQGHCSIKCSYDNFNSNITFIADCRQHYKLDISTKPPRLATLMPTRSYLAMLIVGAAILAFVVVLAVIGCVLNFTVKDYLPVSSADV